MPAEVVDAVRLACGLAEKERHVAERLARCMTDFEKEALAKWAQDAAHGITCRKSAEGGITGVVMRLINYIK